MYHNKDAIGDEGNGKLPHKMHFPGKNSEPCLWFLLHSKTSMLNTIGDEGNGKPPHRMHHPRENLEPCLWLLLGLKSCMQHIILQDREPKMISFCMKLDRSLISNKIIEIISLSFKKEENLS